MSDIIAFISGMKKVLYISCVPHPKIACKENGKGNKRRARVGEKPKPEAREIDASDGRTGNGKETCLKSLADTRPAAPSLIRKNP